MFKGILFLMPFEKVYLYSEKKIKVVKFDYCMLNIHTQNLWQINLSITFKFQTNLLF